ncbi:MAG: hydrogenase 4 subunit B [Bacillota bacterium]
MNAQSLFLLAILFHAAGAAAALALHRRARLASRLSGISALAGGVAGAAAGLAVLTGGAPFGLELPGLVPFAPLAVRVDALSAFILLVIGLLAAAVGVYSLAYDVEYAGPSAGILGSLTHLFALSMLLVAAAADAFHFLVFWEVMTLASYFLVVFRQDQEAVGAGLLYFGVAHAAAAALMVAVVLLYLETGSFDFAAFRGAALSPALRSLLFVLILIGFGTKAGVVPLHFWLPRAYPAAPATGAALLSAKVAVYGLIRFGVDLLGAPAVWWGLAVLAVGALSAVTGALYAAEDRDLGRVLAYSSVENVGIMLMGIGAGMAGLASGHRTLAVLGLTAGLFHLLGHALFKGLLFLGAGAVVARVGTRNLERMGGLARQMPWTSAGFLTGALAASALPPLNGFVSEWLTYQALVRAHASAVPAVKVLAPLGVAALAMAGALAALCFVRAYGAAFGGPARSGRPAEVQEAPGPMVAGIAFLAAACLGLGLGAPAVAPLVAAPAEGLAAAAGLAGGAVSVAAGASLLAPGDPQAVLSTPLVAILLIGALALPLVMGTLHGGLRPARRVDAEPWAAGYAYSPRMAGTARGFAQPLRVLFRPFFQVRPLFPRLGAALAPGWRRTLAALAVGEDWWERWLHRPLALGALALGRQVQRLEQGNVRLYALYIIATLLILLLAVVR